jgi:hypothetical protein
MRRMIIAGQALVLGGIILGILTFGTHEIVIAICVVSLGEVVWIIGWIMRGFNDPHQ